MIVVGLMTERLAAAAKSEDAPLQARGAALRVPWRNLGGGVRISCWGDL